MRIACAGLLLALCAGCGGGPRIAPVSGVVTVNGKPQKGLIVSFQPLGSKDNPNPGRGSTGVTDENGRFTLSYDGAESGAVVGTHRVRIFSDLGADIPDTEGDFKAADAAAKAARGKRVRETIPIEWHEKSEKTFDVPPGGTDRADFDIETARPKG